MYAEVEIETTESKEFRLAELERKNLEFSKLLLELRNKHNKQQELLMDIMRKYIATLSELNQMKANSPVQKNSA